jgi:tetratricopeptide (TPR) repeat protein
VVLDSPRITDFGLAKYIGAEGPQTKTGAMLGTPCYMAPEQAAGSSRDIGPAADQYSLGVILYELLTGRPPFEAESAWLTLQLVRYDEPLPPSRLRHRLPRDLETICLKCLQKEPRRRYASAQALADDLGRFLDGRPILARPVGPGERVARWCRRKPVVAGLLAALVLVFLTGFTGILWQWQRAERHADRAEQNAAALASQRDTAVQERERAERLLKEAHDAVDRLTRLGEEMIQQPRLSKAGQDVLQQTLRFYQAGFKEQSPDPTVRLQMAQALNRVGIIYHNLAQWQQADAAFKQAIDLLRELADQYPAAAGYRLNLARIQVRRGNALRDRRQLQAASEAYAAAVQLFEVLVEEDRRRSDYLVYLANALINWVTAFWNQSQWEKTESFYLRAHDLVKKALALAPRSRWIREERALILDDYSEWLCSRGRHREAEEPCNQALGYREQIYKEGYRGGGFPRYVARSYNRLGTILAAAGRHSEAEAAHRRALEFVQALVADFPAAPFYRAELSDVWLHLGAFLQDTGRHAEAAAAHREALKADPEDPASLNRIAWRLLTCPDPRFRDLSLAADLVKQNLQLAPERGKHWTTQGVLQYRKGEWPQAVAALEKAVQLTQGGEAADWFFLAMAHAQQGDPKQARKWYEQAIAWMDTNQPNDAELRRFRTEAEALLTALPLK